MANERVLVLRDNREWLRYVFFAGAAGMCFLLASLIAAPTRETGKIFGSVMGILLLGLCGFVLICQRFEFDPVLRRVKITIKGLRSTSTQPLPFEQIRSVLVSKTFDSVEGAHGRTEMSESWKVSLVLMDRTIPVTTQLYTTEDQAKRQASAIAQMTNAQIAGGDSDGIAGLIQSGRLIDAIKALRQQRGLSLAEAKDQVDKLAGRK